MTADATLHDEVAVVHSRFILFAGIIPGLILTAAVVLQTVWLPDLPDPAAIHFSGSGPDGFGPAWTYPVLTAGVGIGFIALVIMTTLQSSKNGGWGPTQRFLGAFVPAGLVVLCVGLTGTVASQRGLDDARDAPDAGWYLLVGAGIGVIYGVIAWLLQPNVVATASDVREGSARTIAEGERVVWIRTIGVGGVGVVVMAIVGLLTLGLAVVQTINQEPRAWWLWLLTALVAVATITMFVFRVRIDQNGLTATSAAGWPRFRIPLDQVKSARSAEVNPVGDFGGWGLRVAPGNGTGIILRRGEALIVERTNGKKLTITVDDAARAADILLGLRDHAGS